jgi:hypothetical protein
VGFDLSVRFADSTWYPRNRSLVAHIARSLPSALAASPSPTEIWLKDPDSKDPWVYEARILIQPEALLVEVMGFSQIFHRDIRAFIAQLSAETPAELIDDDGERI